MGHNGTLVDMQRKVGQADHDIPFLLQQQLPRRVHDLIVGARRLHQAALDDLDTPPGSGQPLIEFGFEPVLRQLASKRNSRTRIPDQAQDDMRFGIAVDCIGAGHRVILRTFGEPLSNGTFQLGGRGGTT
ncbi:hypothetical protein GCM10009641_23520 [Mycobacterium cookii]|uniref:Uncharacterized protein n=1 Tax=Mycobacterium cookii TaxID=1775 RepID=A0A7I7KTM4_9MYCO|nr:hypothetical protein MCOO_10710 [Mycobacterium cookii]